MIIKTYEHVLHFYYSGVIASNGLIFSAQNNQSNLDKLDSLIFLQYLELLGGLLTFEKLY